MYKTTKMKIKFNCYNCLTYTFFLLSALCGTEENFIQLLVKNKIPIVLNLNLNLTSNLYPKEIYIYISSEVEHNILKPAVKQKQYITQAFCQYSDRIRIIRNNKNFRVYYHEGKHLPRTDIYFVVLKNPEIETLTIFCRQEDNEKYYGIKNKTIIKHTNSNINKIKQKYLL